MRTSQDQIPLAIFWIANSVFLVGWCYFAHWTPCHLYFIIHCSISHTLKAWKQVIQVASGRTLAWRLVWWIRRVCWVIGRRAWKEKVEKKSKRSVGPKCMQGNYLIKISLRRLPGPNTKSEIFHQTHPPTNWSIFHFYFSFFLHLCLIQIKPTGNVRLD